MSQVRIYNFGATATAGSENLWRSVVIPEGVYQGFKLGVNAFSDLTIEPGGGVQPNGVVWLEQDIGVIVEFNPPAIASDYTVVALHENREIFGGVAVSYELETGLLTSVTDGVVLGWIRHPGGGAPLDTTMLQNAPKASQDAVSALLVETAPIEIIPAYPRAYLDTATLGVDITVTPQVFDVATFTMLQRVERSLAGVPGLQTAVQHFQFYVSDSGFRPIGFDFWLNFTAAPTREVRVEVYDTNQSPVTITSGTPILSTAGWEQKSVELDLNSGTFDPLKPFTLRLTFQVDAGGTIDIGRIRQRTYPFPA